MKKNSTLVSIIIVNFNGEKFVDNCLNSILHQTYDNYEILLVDNNSSDRSLIYIKSHFPKVSLISLDRNVGFAEGCNTGLRQAAGKLVMLLNPDAEAEESIVENLVLFLESNPQFRVAVPKIYFSDRTTLEACGAQYNSIGNGYGIGYGEKDIGQFDHLLEVPAATGCCMMINKCVFDKTYLFDKRFFMYFEEIDFSIRLRRVGFKIGFCKSARVFHAGSLSVMEAAPNNQMIFKQSYAGINRLSILIKYYPFSILIRNSLLIILSYLFWDIFFLTRSNRRSLAGYLFNQAKQIPVALLERASLPTAISNDWIRDIEYMPIRNLLNWAKFYYGESKNLSLLRR